MDSSQIKSHRECSSRLSTHFPDVPDAVQDHVVHVRALAEVEKVDAAPQSQFSAFSPLDAVYKNMCISCPSGPIDDFSDLNIEKRKKAGGLVPVQQQPERREGAGDDDARDLGSRRRTFLRLNISANIAYFEIFI